MEKNYQQKLVILTLMLWFSELWIDSFAHTKRQGVYFA